MVVYPGNVGAQNSMLQIPTSGSGAQVRPSCEFTSLGTLYLSRGSLYVCLEWEGRPVRSEVTLDFGDSVLNYAWMQLAQNAGSGASIYGGFEYATMDGCPEIPGTPRALDSRMTHERSPDAPPFSSQTPVPSARRLAK